MKLLFTLLVLIGTNALFASSFNCYQQRALAKLSDKKLFGFNITELPLSPKLAQDHTKVVTKGSCVFQVFYMFTYSDANRADGWYFPMYVSVDSGASTVFEESLVTDGIDKLQTIQAGMSEMRMKLNTCSCSIP